MNPSTPNWFVITGAPSAGKTTLRRGLELKGYRSLPESARIVIDRGLAAGQSLEEIRHDELAFQLEVLKMKQELEGQLPGGEIVFLDRGMHDTEAYFKLHGFPINDQMRAAIKAASYRAVFLLELGKFKKDYARSENAAEARKLEVLLENAYREAGMPVVRVPWSTPQQRLVTVLKHVKEFADQPVV